MTAGVKCTIEQGRLYENDFAGPYPPDIFRASKYL